MAMQQITKIIMIVSTTSWSSSRDTALIVGIAVRLCCINYNELRVKIPPNLKICFE